MQQLALFTLPRLEIDENDGKDVPSEAGLMGKESSDEEDRGGISEFEFDSNPSNIDSNPLEEGPWEDQESGGGGGGTEESRDTAR